MIHFVEKTWGIHFVMGGTGELVLGFVKKFQELGGTIHYDSEVSSIEVEGKRFGKKTAKGITLANGTSYTADVVVSNGDYANTYMKLIEPKYRFIQSRRTGKSRLTASQHHSGSTLRRTSRRNLRAKSPQPRLLPIPSRPILNRPQHGSSRPPRRLHSNTST